jgi:hypothetical protein
MLADTKLEKGGEEEEKRRRKIQTKGVTPRKLQYQLACCHYGLFLAIVSIPGNYPDYTIYSHL